MIKQGLITIALAIGITAMANDKTVNLSTLGDYKPFCFVDEGKAPPTSETLKPGEDSKYLKGLSWDIVRSSFHESGYTINLSIVP